MGEVAEALRRSRQRSENKRVNVRRSAPLRLVASQPIGCEVDPRRGHPQPVHAEPHAGAMRPPAPVVPPARSSYGVARAKISKQKTDLWEARVAHVEDASQATESFRHFAILLGRELIAKKTNTVLVTSASRGEGRTTTSCNLALALASLSARARVALLDLDLRNPSLGDVLRIRPRVGFDDVLAGRAPLCDAQIRTDHDLLDVFLVKQSRERAHQLLVGEKLAQSIAELSAHYGVVILDTPPALPVPDANIIAQHVGACVPIARAGVTRLAAFDSMRKALPAEKVIGAFLNRAYKESVDRS